MEVFLGKRASGKTTELIKKSASTGAVIVAINPKAAKTVKNANISSPNVLQLRCEMRYSVHVDMDTVTTLIADRLAGKYLDSGHNGHSFAFEKRIKKPTIATLGSIEVTISYKVDGE